MKTPNFETVTRLYEEKKQQFDAYRRLLQEYNKRYNLTSITDDEGICYKHFYDSLAGAECFDMNARVCEVGSGGGFPSLPLKIVRDDLSFVLLESTGKKCAFLKEVVNQLQLKNVEIINCRAEEIAHAAEYREQFDVCCARAVARLNTLAEYCMPFVRVGGIFLSYKGEAKEEIEEAKKAVALLGGGQIQSCEYPLFSYGMRSLVAVEKVKKTPVLYPRGHGKERTKPL